MVNKKFYKVAKDNLKIYKHQQKILEDYFSESSNKLTLTELRAIKNRHGWFRFKFFLTIRNPEFFRFFKDDPNAMSLFNLAFNKTVFVFRFLSEDKRTEAVCLAAVQKDGEALKHVPEKMKTEAICLAAVQENASALKYVPKKMKTEAVCLKAVQQGGWISALKWVPEEMKTEAICLAAVQQNGEALEYVPKDRINLSMSYFVSINPKSLQRNECLPPKRTALLFKFSMEKVLEHLKRLEQSPLDEDVPNVVEIK